jgi:hypothetical protein
MLASDFTHHLSTSLTHSHSNNSFYDFFALQFPYPVCATVHSGQVYVPACYSCTIIYTNTDIRWDIYWVTCTIHYFWTTLFLRIRVMWCCTHKLVEGKMQFRPHLHLNHQITTICFCTSPPMYSSSVGSGWPFVSGRKTLCTMTLTVHNAHSTISVSGGHRSL